MADGSRHSIKIDMESVTVYTDKGTPVHAMRAVGAYSAAYVRIGILNKHTQLVYHYKPGAKQIEILLFWNFKQNPARFKY